MPQDVQGHIREIELRLSGILAGEECTILSRRTATPTESPGHDATPAVNLEQKLSSFRSALPQAIALLVIIALLGVTIVYLQWQTSATDVKATIADKSAMETPSKVDQLVTDALQRAERATGDALSIAAQAERMMAVMSAPDARRVELIPSATLPAALGQIIWSRTNGMIVTAANVPPSAAGETYQIWIETDGGPLSLGFAAVDAHRRVRATYEMPALTKPILRVRITREPAGGSAEPTGEVLFSS